MLKVKILAAIVCIISFNSTAFAADVEFFVDYNVSSINTNDLSFEVNINIDKILESEKALREYTNSNTLITRYSASDVDFNILYLNSLKTTGNTRLLNIINFMIKEYNYDHKYWKHILEGGKTYTKHIDIKRMQDSKLGLCGELSVLFAVLCRQSNIPCQVIRTPEHIWNRVYFEGSWVDIDLTPIIDGTQINKLPTFRTNINLSTVEYSVE